ncbi:WXG100-like domain-containing protein [Flindersiella endophytica]
MAQGMVLPDWAISLLDILGYTWPDADEVRMMEIGQKWQDFQDKLNDAAEQAQKAAESVWNNNDDKAIDKFKESWAKSGEAMDILRKDAEGVSFVGTVILICAAAVLLLKILVIAQLVMLAITIAEAIAAAPETFGASLLIIPAAKYAVGLAIDFLIDQALEALVG